MSLGTGRNTRKISTFVANFYCAKDPTQVFQNNKMEKKSFFFKNPRFSSAWDIAHCAQIYKSLRHFIRELFFNMRSKPYVMLWSGKL